MSERKNVLPLARRPNWQKRIVIATAIVGILGAIAILSHDTKEFEADFSAELSPGSLIVNINTATTEELQTLPGIGATRAVQIIVGRPYKSVDELVNVVGIADVSLDGLRPFITIEGETKMRVQ